MVEDIFLCLTITRAVFFWRGTRFGCNLLRQIIAFSFVIRFLFLSMAAKRGCQRTVKKIGITLSITLSTPTKKWMCLVFTKRIQNKVHTTNSGLQMLKSRQSRIRSNLPMKYLNITLKRNQYNGKELRIELTGTYLHSELWQHKAWDKSSMQRPSVGCTNVDKRIAADIGTNNGFVLRTLTTCFRSKSRSK